MLVLEPTGKLQFEKQHRIFLAEDLFGVCFCYDSGRRGQNFITNFPYPSHFQEGLQLRGCFLNCISFPLMNQGINVFYMLFQLQKLWEDSSCFSNDSDKAKIEQIQLQSEAGFMEMRLETASRR